MGFNIKYNPVFMEGIEFVGIAEGGISNDKDDSGGFTKYGISSKAYPLLNIQTLTWEHAVAIYYRDYWLASGCHHFDRQIAIYVFDSAVNCGVPRVSKWVQTACNILGSTLSVDGIVGKVTIEAVKGINQWKLYSVLISMRIQHYSTICENHPNQIKFLKGWLNRVSKLIMFCSA